MTEIRIPTNPWRLLRSEQTVDPDHPHRLPATRVNEDSFPQVTRVVGDENSHRPQRTTVKDDGDMPSGEQYKTPEGHHIIPPS